MTLPPITAPHCPAWFSRRTLTAGGAASSPTSTPRNGQTLRGTVATDRGRGARAGADFESIRDANPTTIR